MKGERCFRFVVSCLSSSLQITSKQTMSTLRYVLKWGRMEGGRVKEGREEREGGRGGRREKEGGEGGERGREGRRGGREGREGKRGRGNLKRMERKIVPFYHVSLQPATNVHLLSHIS